MSGALQTAGDVGGQGLGTLLNIADILMSARQGHLGQTLLSRATALQDPAARESISSSPLLAGFLGQYGSRQPNPEVQRAGGQIPGVDILGPGQEPGTPQGSRFQANLPPLGPAAQGKLALAATALPYRALQMKSLEAQVGKQAEQARYLKRFNDSGVGGSGGGGGADAGPNGGLVRTGMTYGINGPTETFGQPPAPVVLPFGTKGREGVVEPGSKVGGRDVLVKPDAAAERAQSQAQIARDDNALNARTVLQVIPALRKAASTYLYDAKTSSGLGVMGQVGTRLTNVGKQAYQSNVALPNVLSSGAAPEFRTAVNKVIPLIRAAAAGTKGLRITQTEFDKEGGPFSHPENYSRQDFLSYLDKIEADMKQVAKGTVQWEPNTVQWGEGAGRRLGHGQSGSSGRLDEINALRQSLSLGPLQ